MGIGKLESVVKVNPKLFTDIQLCATNLVIEGNSFCHQVNKRSGIDSLFAGGYIQYEKMINRYLDRFESANITPTFIFDGLLDVETLKKAKSKERLDDRLKKAKSIVSSTAKLDDCDGTEAMTESDESSDSDDDDVTKATTESKSIKLLKPLFAQQVLVDILIDRGIKIYQCAGEADAMAVGLANQLHAPLLSFDSDFYIFDLKFGYIPFKKIKLSDRDDTSFIKAELYKLENLLGRFPGVKRELLPLFAFLCGNDFSADHDLRKFLEYIHRGKEGHVYAESSTGTGLNVPTQAEQTYLYNIPDVLEWLRDKKGDKKGEQEAIKKALSSIERQRHGVIREAIKRSTDAYRRCEPADGSFDLTSAIKGDIAGLKLPDWFVEEYVSGKMPAILLRIRRDHKVYLKALIQDFSKPSVYEYCRPIRLAVYRILLKHVKRQSVSEFDHDGDKYVEQPPLSIDGNNEGRDKNRLPQLNSVQSISIGDRQKMFIAVFEFSADESSIIDKFPDRLRLFACSFVYWYRSSGVRATSRQARALLLSAVCLSNDDQDSRQRLLAIDNNIEGNEYRKSTKRASAVSNLHAFSQWQACYEACVWLDAVLARPFGPTVSPQRLFHGRIAYILSKPESTDLDRLLEVAPTLRETFVRIWDLVEKLPEIDSNANPWQNTPEKKANRKPTKVNSSDAGTSGLRNRFDMLSPE